MQEFNEYGVHKREFKKGCLRTDDIEGAKPKSFQRHIWGDIKTDRNHSYFHTIEEPKLVPKEELHTSRRYQYFSPNYNNQNNYVPEIFRFEMPSDSSRNRSSVDGLKKESQPQYSQQILRNPLNFQGNTGFKEDSSGTGHNNLQQQQQHRKLVPKLEIGAIANSMENSSGSQSKGKIRNESLKTSPNQQQQYQYQNNKASSPDIYVENQLQQQQQFRLPKIATSESQISGKKYQQIAQELQQNAEKDTLRRNRSKNALQNQFEVGMLTKIDEFSAQNHKPDFSQGRLKQRHHFPQSQFFREKIFGVEGEEKLEKQNIFQQKQVFESKPEIDNLNKLRNQQREKLWQEQMNYKVHLFNDPKPLPPAKVRLHLQDIYPYKFNPLHKNVSSIVF